ncbi:MAG: 1-deoxy-D-xylulose-5-phosphate reductoisomerase [Ignavibacteriae bacterium]|nr:1-deoxy-D-xylulose-5-phosphate reductoisomerase [Ignavibacteriota bacterium]MCB9215337.1 1-deoxy-D-xylulose-5-phosphate reductoisomerase [Ignavibacteria bacterium]
MNSSLTILGSTGSIGTQTLDVVREHPERFRVRYLTTNQNLDLLEKQIEEFQPEGVVICDEKAAEEGEKRFGNRVSVLSGEDACVAVATDPNVEIVMSAMVGFAGLRPTIEAARSGKLIALANKETLVVAGHLIAEALSGSGARLIPVDSEHSAVFQSLVGEERSPLSKVILTASGGPFRKTPVEEFEEITPERALKHPNWEMGAKITIDSATMMNKGLEVIEASRLFNVAANQIEVVVHPESIIHSMVLFHDGSIKAQLSLPDMRMPIRYALGWPERIPGTFEPLDLPKLGSLTFEEPDLGRFPCLNIAYQVLEREGTAPTVLNAANEIVVAAFLERSIRFTDIPKLIERALGEIPVVDDPSLQDIFDIDKRTREVVRSYVVPLHY